MIYGLRIVGYSEGRFQGVVRKYDTDFSPFDIDDESFDAIVKGLANLMRESLSSQNPFVGHGAWPTVIARLLKNKVISKSEVQTFADSIIDILSKVNDVAIFEHFVATILSEPFFKFLNGKQIISLRDIFNKHRLVFPTSFIDVDQVTKVPLKKKSKSSREFRMKRITYLPLQTKGNGYGPARVQKVIIAPLLETRKDALLEFTLGADQNRVGKVSSLARMSQLASLKSFRNLLRSRGILDEEIMEKYAYSDLYYPVIFSAIIYEAFQSSERKLVTFFKDYRTFLTFVFSNNPGVFAECLFFIEKNRHQFDMETVDYSIAGMKTVTAFLEAGVLSPLNYWSGFLSCLVKERIPDYWRDIMREEKVLEIFAMIKSQHSQQEFEESLAYFMSEVFTVKTHYIKHVRLGVTDRITSTVTEYFDPMELVLALTVQYQEEVTRLAPMVIEDLPSTITTLPRRATDTIRYLKKNTRQ